MYSIKEVALKERTDNYRQSLESNYESSRTKMSEKLRGLKKDVEYLRDNLSKTVRKALENNGEKSAKSVVEGKPKSGKFESRSTDLLNGIESRIVQLNERISDLKTWNISQLNQLDFQETELDDFLEKMSEELKEILLEHSMKKENAVKIEKKLVVATTRRRSSLKLSKSEAEKLESNKTETQKSVSFESDNIHESREHGERPDFNQPVVSVSPVDWSKADDSIFLRELSHASALWEKLISKKTEQEVDEIDQTSQIAEILDNDNKNEELARFHWFFANDQIRDHFLKKVWSDTSGKISSTKEVHYHMERFLEQERKREKRKQEIEKWKEKKMKEGFQSKLDQMKAKIKKATVKQKQKQKEETQEQAEKREMVKMRQSLRNADRLLRAIAV